MSHQGLIDCFPAGLQSPDGEVVYCEASALVFDGSHVVFASDKPVPGEGRSSVFSFAYAGRNTIEGIPVYQTSEPFISAIKYEDMTLTIDGAFVIATTGFDRVKPDSVQWDGYNTLLIWPVTTPDDVAVVSATTTDGVTSSVGLRDNLSRVLTTEEFPEGMPYFKIEGIAVIPGQKILLGIRETGSDYREFEYTAIILSVSFTLLKDELVLGSDFEQIYRFDPGSDPGIPKGTGLSSIEYDPYNDRLYLLTSYETEQTDVGLGGHLWVLPMADMKMGLPPSLVHRDVDHPLSFAHKPEGVTVLKDNRVLVVHDDDRVLGRDTVNNPKTQFSKAAHQTAYSVVTLTGDASRAETAVTRPSANESTPVQDSDGELSAPLAWIIIIVSLAGVWWLTRGLIRYRD